MKKALTIAFAAILNLSAFAQGQISIRETTFKISVGGTEIATMTANAYVFDVLEYIGSGTPVINIENDLVSANWVDTGAYGFNGSAVPTVGTVAGATTTTVTAGASGWSQDTLLGSAQYFVVVGWSSIGSAVSEGGASWSTISAEINNYTWVVGGYFGYSNIGNITASISPALGETVWQPGGATAFNLFQINSVPEPAATALAGLGGLSLLVLRRKK